MLYVLAAVWAAVFLAYASNPNEAAPLYFGLLAAMATAIINIVFFIFSELRCLKITTDVDEKAKDTADEKFLSIWDTFGLSLAISMALVLVNIEFPQLVTRWSISAVIILGTITDSISSLLPKKVGMIIRNVATPMMLYAFFAVVQLSISI